MNKINKWRIVHITERKLEMFKFVCIGVSVLMNKINK